MEYYSGLDVSLKDTFVTIIDKNGNLVKEQIVGMLRGLLKIYGLKIPAKTNSQIKLYKSNFSATPARSVCL